jgi:hypothetical protein
MNPFDQKENESLEVWYARINDMDRRQMPPDQIQRRAETLVLITSLKKKARLQRRRRF